MRSRPDVRMASFVIVIFLLAATASWAVAPAIQKLLPAKGDVTGFAPMANSLTYGKGDDVSKVYDGGYELYTKKGVIDVARQMYQRGKDYIEVTVHTMKSPKAALDFVKYWAKERGGKLKTTAQYSGFTVSKPNMMGYYAMGKYFVTVSAFYPAAKSAKDLEAFAKAIRKKA